MLRPGDPSAVFSLPGLDGAARGFGGGSDALTLLAFFETDCPTCALLLPYLERLANRLPARSVRVLGVSQDAEAPTRRLVERLGLTLPVVLDRELKASKAYDPLAVPTVFLLDRRGRVLQTLVAFDKGELNALSSALCNEAGVEPFVLAEVYDGAPDSKPGCTSRHLEPAEAGEPEPPPAVYGGRGARATRIALSDETDPYEYCTEAGFADPLPVIPPTVERVERMLRATALPADEIVGRIAPNYGEATVEKIAANAVMAGCPPELIRVLIPLVRAACDERFNLHGVQATTHFAAPLVIVNGPVRRELGFASGSNVFGNVARANSTLGRAFQLILVNLGGARPGEIDMSTLGNPGKFSFCIAENEEESPWEPLHVEHGFRPEQSALTLFAAESPRGVSEHSARTGRGVLRTISRTLATVWSYRQCLGQEAFVVLCPEHVKTLRRDGFTKQQAREFLFENTGVPLREFDADGGEGTQFVSAYEEVVIDGERCYRKFQRPDAIRVVVAGGPAGKFSAVIGGWATGPRGSQVVTYPID